MSSDREIIMEYPNGEITIIWKPKTCIHVAECVKRLPKVYRPKERPWIKIENASTNDLKTQIDACPSGALSYRVTKEIDKIRKEMNKEESHLETKIEVRKNGPLLVYGTLQITDALGKTKKKDKTTAFCRCGESLNKPFCDGAHSKSGFQG